VSSGWVYFAQDGDRTKIGWTSKGVQKRISDLKTAAPTIELVHVIRTDDRQLEKELHKLFKDYRIAREWFALPDNWRSMLPDQHRNRVRRADEVTYGSWDRKSLVGSWFHSFTAEGRFRWQGCVVAALGEGYVLVQTYSWLDGTPSHQHVVQMRTVTDWRFYDTNEEMLEAWMQSAERFELEAGPRESRYADRVVDVAEALDDR